jgi:hypothetical protein
MLGDLPPDLAEAAQNMQREDREQFERMFTQ